jgi:CheY-like chemotaxis protein/nitrogen-specific signal transduction histidine kinase
VFNKNIATLTETKNELNNTNEKLNKTIEEIKELSNVRMRFLSTMSHELRTPLNGVIGLTNVLLHQEPRKDQEETLSVLKFSAENLLALVNDILDFNKLDSNVVELESTPFNLYDLVENIYAATKLKASEKQLDFTFEVADSLCSLTLIGDPTRLTQVLLNLLNNAIKFTERGSVKLSCNEMTFADESVKINFVVEDTGIGIEESRQRGIFDEFVQASISTTRNYGGTGLGLPIVKRVLELYQSTVQIQSRIGSGSKFSFDIIFPYRKNTNSKVKSNAVDEDKTSEWSKLKVLVVEDNAINIMVIRKTLNRMEIDPDVAENGRMALEMIAFKDYDLILMDLYMPELDGYETTKMIRSLTDRRKALVPIIALTAMVSSQVLDDVLAVGMNGYLSKPFHPDDLFDELRKHIN